MKKVLFMMNGMFIGGAERSLAGLLSALDPGEITAELFLLRREGELLDTLPPHVTVLPEIKQYAALGRPLASVATEGRLGVAAGRAVGLLAARSHERRRGTADSMIGLEYSHKYTLPFMPRIGDGYDGVVSFITPHYFAAERVGARRRIAWVHTDYTRVMLDVRSELKMWSRFDAIAAVSSAVADGFSQVFPTLADRVTVIENILDPHTIRHQAEAYKTPEFGGDTVNVLSVGRFCGAKNFDNVPDICARALALGANIKWFLIGYGGDEPLIRRKISEAGMEERVIILGKLDNPYPYIAACDIYSQPSRYEGKAVTVREAQILGRPSVISAFATSRDQLEDGVDGLILPCDNEGFARGLAALTADRERRRSLSETALSRDYSNSGEAKKLLALL